LDRLHRSTALDFIGNQRAESRFDLRDPP